MLSEEDRISLPDRPADQSQAEVAIWRGSIQILTYEPEEPDRFPQFLDRRVYQGSSGKVFPLPFHERIAREPRLRSWDAVHIENRWTRVVVLPELGGRIHIALDRTNGYDVFYRNNVIKPALVGLAGPWIAGGVEFNWPQHHRPATFLPTDVHLERGEDGSATVWCSDHDPFARMKGMHGIRLAADSSAIEARVRLFNRSDQRQTFLWWANVAAAVNDDYQSFFPTDVHHVADHARRVITSFPRVDGDYYGVDYPARVTADRPDGDRIDWYRNIPVPTSYMVTDTDDAFFGGWDHGRKAGFVHWADRAIAPGKKQWTWGDAPFGHAWDAALTDHDGPYVELMAGVFTDNQPDFAFLEPGETKTFSQYWYPIRDIGPAMQATREAAIRVDADGADGLRIGVSAAVEAPSAAIIVTAAGREVHRLVRDLGPDSPCVVEVRLPSGTDPRTVTVSVQAGDRELVAHAWRATDDASAVARPRAAVAPPQPDQVATTEELDLIGTYLEQYRHATRSPEPYWREALRRDPDDVRANLGLGARLHAAGRPDDAVTHLERAVDRLTRWAPTPPSGAAHYRLGLALVAAGRTAEARKALERATWNADAAVAAHLALARLQAVSEPAAALDHVRAIVRQDREHLQARDLAASILVAEGRSAEATALAEETLAIDPLDQWARHIAGKPLTDDATVLLDIALEYDSLGFREQTTELLDLAMAANERRPRGQVNVGPSAAFHLAAVALRADDLVAAQEAMRRAGAIDAVNALPSRLADVAALELVEASGLGTATLAAMLGSWYHDKERTDDAERTWTAGLERHPDAATASLLHRNLGLVAFNARGMREAAAQHLAAARRAAPDDARLLLESDQLAAAMGVDESTRLAVLDAEGQLVAARDDLTVEHALLSARAGDPERAFALMVSRTFQPWEGGEGVVLSAWDEIAIARARALLAAGAARDAVDAVERALDPPASLGEARHPLATSADLLLVLGDALAAAGRHDEAEDAWRRAAADHGDFTAMSTATFTVRSAWSIVASDRLGRGADAARRLLELDAEIEAAATRPAEIDYFATSLPEMLLFQLDPVELRDRRVAQLRRTRDEIAAMLRAGSDRAAVQDGGRQVDGAPVR